MSRRWNYFRKLRRPAESFLPEPYQALIASIIALAIEDYRKGYRQQVTGWGLSYEAASARSFLLSDEVEYLCDIPGTVIVAHIHEEIQEEVKNGRKPKSRNSHLRLRSD